MSDQVTVTLCNNRACDSALPPYRRGVRKLYCSEQCRWDCYHTPALRRIETGSGTATPAAIDARAQINELSYRLDQLRWMMANSAGVVGLNLDGSVMPWPEVCKLYMPGLRTEGPG